MCMLPIDESDTSARVFDYAMMVLAAILGVGSLVLVVVAGSVSFVKMGWPDPLALFWDAMLSSLFFIQHSGMVRRAFRARLAAFIDSRYYGAIYSITSGIALTLVVVLWQKSDTHLLVLQGVPLWIARAGAVSAFVIFLLSVYALRSFDPLGLGPIRAHLRGNTCQPMPFAVSGPYRWVRHPLYFCVLVLIWTAPDLTSDRLLFDILWTLWVYIGTMLEERDLVVTFGDAYREYRLKVPMLIPWRGPAAKR